MLKISEDPISLAVYEEQGRQFELWGEQNHPDGTGAVYLDASTMARDSCDAAFIDGSGTWLHILVEETFEAAAEVDEDKLKVELIQVAAVATSWARAIERRQAANRQIAS